MPGSIWEEDAVFTIYRYAPNGLPNRIYHDLARPTLDDLSLTFTYTNHLHSIQPPHHRPSLLPPLRPSLPPSPLPAVACAAVTRRRLPLGN